MSPQHLPQLPQTARDDNPRITAIVREHGERLRKFLRQRIYGRDAVEDILQEVLLELVESFRLGHDVEAIGGWLMTVARNRLIDRYRKSATRRRLESQMPELYESDGTTNLLRAQPGLEQQLTTDLLLDEMEAALQELPAEQSQVFIEHELHGRSFHSLSEDLGVPVNTLLARKHRAVKFLRVRLSDIRNELLEKLP